MGRYLPEVQAAAGLHAQALECELSGQYEAARAGFADAVQALGQFDPQNAALTVQRARIQRDDGFNTLRMALLEDNDDGIEDAARQLEGARQLTAPFVAGEYPSYVGQVRNFISKHQRWETESEHAATLGYQVRLVVARQVRNREIEFGRVVTDEVLGAQFMGGSAYDLAKRGTNQHHATSIAMRGARREVVNGRRENAGPWLGRAMLSLGKALLHDRDNAGKAVLTIRQLSGDLLSREEAMDAVINHETV